MNFATKLEKHEKLLIFLCKLVYNSGAKRVANNRP